MAKFVYDTLVILLGGGLTEEMADWMAGLFATVLRLINGRLMSTAMNIFAAIACSMLILYFFMDLVDQAKRDMFSLEKLIVSFIKFLAAFVVLLCLKDLVTYVVQIGNFLYLTLSSEGSGTLHDAIVSGSSARIRLFDEIPLGDSGRTSFYEMPDWTTATQDEFEDNFKGILALVKNIQMYVICAIAGVIGFIAKIAGYFICTSNAVLVIARVVFSPIAVVQLFEDGSRSAGMRYLKGLAADCITMAVIIIILYAASAITSGLVVDLTSISEINFSNLNNVITFGNLAIILVPELVAIGAMASGGKIAQDIMGA